MYSAGGLALRFLRMHCSTLDDLNSGDEEEKEEKEEGEPDDTIEEPRDRKRMSGHVGTEGSCNIGEAGKPEDETLGKPRRSKRLKMK